MIVAETLTISRSAVIAAAVVAGLLLITAALLVWRARRGLVRRVVNVSLRLEDTPSTADHRFLDKNLGRLERAVDSAVLARGEATVAVGRMAQALETIPQGVVLCDEHGDVTFRNRAATTFSSARHGDALVGAAIEEMLRKALDGDSDTSTLDLFGPPGARSSSPSRRSTTKSARSARSESSTMSRSAGGWRRSGVTSSPTSATS